MLITVDDLFDTFYALTAYKQEVYLINRQYKGLVDDKEDINFVINFVIDSKFKVVYSLLIKLILRVEDREHLLIQDAEEAVHHDAEVGVSSRVVPGTEVNLE